MNFFQRLAQHTVVSEPKEKKLGAGDHDTKMLVAFVDYVYFKQGKPVRTDTIQKAFSTMFNSPSSEVGSKLMKACSLGWLDRRPVFGQVMMKYTPRPNQRSEYRTELEAIKKIVPVLIGIAGDLLQ